MRRWLLLGICIIICLGAGLGTIQPGTALAQTQISHPRVEYTFGLQITFRADLETQAGVSEASFYFRRPEDPAPNRIPIKVDQADSLVYEYDTMRYPLRAFSRVDYWFEVQLENGETISSDRAVFYYEDNRFDWQMIQSNPFRVHWYEGDAAFGQELMFVAQRGLQQAKTWLPVSDPDPEGDQVNIYVYASAQEMRSTNMLAGNNWIAGHADPDLLLIEVSISPGPEQYTEMERQIPHELMHILLYLTVGSAYSTLPSWLNEGLASLNEIYPNPYYHTILSQAASKQSLLALSDICQNFPVDASGAYLAYAEAASFTRYLYDQYGPDGLKALLDAYAHSQATDCQDGSTTQALGVPLSQLERRWRQTVLGEASGTTPDGSLWPWVTVLGIVLLVPALALAASLFRRGGRPQPAMKTRRSV